MSRPELPFFVTPAGIRSGRGVRNTPRNSAFAAGERIGTGFAPGRGLVRRPRGPGAVDPATAASFSHHPDGSTRCAPTGAASTNAQVLQWLAEVAAAFPRASADEQQVAVTMPGNEVVIRLCWRNSEADSPHMLEVSNRVQWP